VFHCQAQLVSSHASGPWQRGFPITPDHTEELEAGREGRKATHPHLVLVPLHLPRKLEDGNNRKRVKERCRERRLRLHLSLLLPVLYPFLHKIEVTTIAVGRDTGSRESFGCPQRTEGGLGLTVLSPFVAPCHPTPRTGGKMDTAKSFDQKSTTTPEEAANLPFSQLSRQLPHF